MPAPYDLPTNITGVASMGDYVNGVTGGFFGIGVLVVTAFVIFVTLHQRYSSRVSLGASAMIVGVLSILWRFAGMIPDYMMFAVIGLGMCSILYLNFTKE